MTILTPSVDAPQSTDDASPRPLITAHESRPNRLVLTEDGNTDGWIASDVTVDVTHLR